MNNLDQRIKREQEFFDHRWSTFDSLQKPIPYRAVFDKVMPYSLDALAQKHVMVCSCGDLRHVPFFAHETTAKVSFIDISSEAVRREQTLLTTMHNGNANSGAVMDCHLLAYRDNSFDLVYGHLVLHHVEMKRVLPEIWRVLKANGWCLFCEPYQNSVIRVLRDFIYPLNRERQRVRNGRLGFRRVGTADENPLDSNDLLLFKQVFGQARFEFFEFGYLRALSEHLLATRKNGLAQLLNQTEFLIPRFIFRLGPSIYIIAQKRLST